MSDELAAAAREYTEAKNRWLASQAGTPVCGVCGSPVTDDSFEPPTFSMVEVGAGVMRPVPSKPIRMDPETGAVCWCQPGQERPRRPR